MGRQRLSGITRPFLQSKEEAFLQSKKTARGWEVSFPPALCPRGMQKESAVLDGLMEKLRAGGGDYFCSLKTEEW